MIEPLLDAPAFDPADPRWADLGPLLRAGRAVLGSDHGGLAEMLADGAGGWSVSPADPRAWSSAFHRVSESPDELARLGKSARERAERDHQFPDLMQRTLDLYDRVTRERD